MGAIIAFKAAIGDPSSTTHAAGNTQDLAVAAGAMVTAVMGSWHPGSRKVDTHHHEPWIRKPESRIHSWASCHHTCISTPGSWNISAEKSYYELSCQKKQDRQGTGLCFTCTPKSCVSSHSYL